MKPILLIAVLLLLTSLLSAEWSWKYMGLDTVEVTTLCCSPQGLLIGTKDNGVFIYYSYSKDIERLISFMPPSLDSSFIYSLLALHDGWTMFAGTNHGLYVYIATMAVPRWMEISEIPKSNVWALHFTGDSTLFVACQDNIYRGQSMDGYWYGNIKWDTLDIKRILPPYQQLPSFRSIISVPGNPKAIYAGSVFSGSYSSWTGVVRSLDMGNTWEIWNQGWESSVPSVYALEAFRDFWNSPVTLLSGTQQDIYSREESANTWQLWTNSSLENRQVYDLHATFYTKSTIARLYAGTDSGVYTYDYGWNTVNWLKMEGDISELAVNAITSNRSMDADSLFAGTGKGLYLYADHDPSPRENKGTSAQQRGNLDVLVSPNPFTSRIFFNINCPGKEAVVSIFNTRGELIKQISKAAYGKAVWDAGNYPGGLYLGQVKIDRNLFVKKILLVK